ncbi:response regulator transcription factor [Streptomyces humicola]|uniref:response regulator transcription factor n=1 Tax=Streptomyces humicola TaxID=2953240 RepID=UPI0027E312A6|nr:response regulator transcription factor [Streptomyces humicola]
MIRVLFVHDTCLLRSALAALLDRENDLDVMTAPWRTAAHSARSLRPDVCMVDADCPGSAALGTPAAPTELSALLVLASASKPGLLRRASRARAMGYVNKDAPAEGLPRAIRHVAAGKRFVDNSLGFDFLQAADLPLTPRELSVLSLAAEGASVAEIASHLHLSNGTVRNYMAAITRKTGARNRVDAIRISQGAGWL